MLTSRPVVLLTLMIVCPCWGILAPNAQAEVPQLTAGPGLKATTAVRITERPTIDGVLDEPAWQDAARISDLTQWFPGNGDPPTEPTEVLIARDDDNLYLAARFRDADPAGIKAQQLVQGSTVVNDDYLQIILDPYNSKRTGYLFYVNPNGVQRDGLALGGMAFNMDWDGIWEAAAQIDEQGWVAEIALPFKTLSFDPDNDVWRINFMRSIRRKREELAWSHQNRRFTMDLAGELRGMRGGRQGLGLDLVPSVAVSQRERFAVGGSSLLTKPSLDAFWRLTPNMTAALTLNTDFSATEVDDRQVNLTRFSLFFPEKRDFFLDNSELFEFGGLTQNARPFFSRTIGLSALGQPIDLDFGAKLAGRLGRYGLGALAVRQAANGVVPARDLFVGRGLVNLGEQSALGAIVTVGDPTSNGWSQLLGVDFNYRDRFGAGNEIAEARGWWQESQARGLEQDNKAWGLYLGWPNDALNASLSVAEIGRNFRPALGFVNRAGVRQYDAVTKYRYRFADREARFKSWLFGGELHQFDSLAGGLESRSLIATPFTLDTLPGDTFAVDLIRNTEILAAPFLLPNGLRVGPGRYDFDRLRFYSTLAGYRTLGINLDLETGDFYDGSRDDARVTINLRPNRHLLMAGQYAINRIELPRGRFTVRNYSLTANVAFNVRWAWLNVVQYDNVSGRLGVNSRLRWLPGEGQSMYFVVNYDWREDPLGNFRPSIAETTLKLNYTFRY
jgi:hypothetical protein